MSNPAEIYEFGAVPLIFDPWASRLIQTANPRPGERVLDVGCGTGVVARRVAARTGASGKVVGLDLNPDMLAVARDAAARDGVAIAWHEGRAETLPFPNGSFDLVLCQFALMFFADWSAALREMHRVLADDGRIALSVFQGLDRHPFYQTLDAAIERRLGMSGVRDIFALGDANELRTLLTDAGFRNAEVEPVSITARFPDPGKFLVGEIEIDAAAIPSMQHLDARARQELVASLDPEMEEPLREVTEGDHVVLPFHALIARADS